MRYSNNVIQWAMQHDWFANADSNGNLWVWDRYFDRDNGYHEAIIKWEQSVEALRAWAGY